MALNRLHDDRYRSAKHLRRSRSKEEIMIGSKLPWRIVLGLALLVAVTGCTNTFRGAQRDVDNLLANRRATSDVTSSSASSTKKGAADEWVDPR